MKFGVLVFPGSNCDHDTFHVIDALTHQRPYKEALTVREATAEIRTLTGSHFDPHVVEAFDALDPCALLAPVR